MADEALRELLQFCRANESYYRQRAQRFYERIGSESMCNADITSEQYRTRADALESALSELARLRAEGDTGMFHSQSAPADAARDHPTDE